MASRNAATFEDRQTDPALCTCANLRMAARTVTQAYDRALAPAGLKLTQFTLLTTLERLGDAPLTTLAEKLVMDRTTLTRNLRPLIDRGLIEALDVGDKRIRQLSLSKEGTKVLRKARPRWERAQAATVRGLGPEHWQRLLDGLAIAVTVSGDGEQ